MRTLSPRVLFWISEASYVVLALITGCFFAGSLVSLLLQAVRTAPTRSWRNNWNAVCIAATYVLVVSTFHLLALRLEYFLTVQFLVSIALCIRRRVAVRKSLQRISKVYTTVNQTQAPKQVREYISQEFSRACLVSYECQPRHIIHPGWGRPGTEYCGIRFRRALLDTIADIDAKAHLVIPSHPRLKPHARMLRHFRFILPLLPKDGDGLTPLHYYDSSIQLARTSHREPTEEEFLIGMLAANQIGKILNECRIEMLEDSSIRLTTPVA
ncbi:hypothetical protein EDD15DRAFT_1107747 [Pisolithus albus]|nr:hypothetical protein EDD15DRAFT_1107747 [Pisolithus albus]